MSLKAFHLLFIGLSIVLALGTGGWGISQYRAGGNWGHLTFGVGWLVAAGWLIYYARLVFRKLKGMSYL